MKRQEFWETTVSGSFECWSVLKACCGSDESNFYKYIKANSFAMLAASGMKLVNKSLQMAFDDMGNKYEVPIFCVNEPSSFENVKLTNVNFIKQ